MARPVVWSVGTDALGSVTLCMTEATVAVLAGAAGVCCTDCSPAVCGCSSVCAGAWIWGWTEFRTVAAIGREVQIVHEKANKSNWPDHCHHFPNSEQERKKLKYACIYYILTWIIAYTSFFLCDYNISFAVILLTRSWLMSYCSCFVSMDVK